MYQGHKVIVVMPAYNAEATLSKTYDEVMAQGIVDRVIIVDDASTDATTRVARGLSASRVVVHQENRGYGGNQKTCYRNAIEDGADIVIMVHPDYQYTPKLIPAIVSLVASGVYDCVIGSRILGGRARAGGMPLWRYVANRGLTLIENLLLGSKLSEFHTGYRAFSREVLERVTLDRLSDDFVFDNQMLAQVLWLGFLVGEVSCPTRYAAEASSINFPRSVRYGLGCLATGLAFRAAKAGLWRSAVFPPAAGKW